MIRLARQVQGAIPKCPDLRMVWLPVDLDPNDMTTSDFMGCVQRAESWESYQWFVPPSDRRKSDAPVHHRN